MGVTLPQARWESSFCDSYPLNELMYLTAVCFTDNGKLIITLWLIKVHQVWPSDQWREWENACWSRGHMTDVSDGEGQEYAPLPWKCARYNVHVHFFTCHIFVYLGTKDNLFSVNWSTCVGYYSELAWFIACNLPESSLFFVQKDWVTYWYDRECKNVSGTPSFLAVLACTLQGHMKRGLGEETWWAGLIWGWAVNKHLDTEL